MFVQFKIQKKTLSGYVYKRGEFFAFINVSECDVFHCGRLDSKGHSKAFILKTSSDSQPLTHIQKSWEL